MIKLFDISNSALESFKCPFRGYLTYIKKLKVEEEMSGQLAQGKAFHILINLMYKYFDFVSKDDSPTYKWLYDRWRDVYFDQFEGYKKISKKIDYLYDGYDLLFNFYEMMLKNSWNKKPFYTERYFDFNYKDFRVVFKIDLIFKDDVNLEIFDWKTGKSKYVEDNNQMALYCFGVTRVLSNGYKVKAKLVFPSEVKVIDYELTKVDLLKLFSDIDKVIFMYETFLNDENKYVKMPSKDICKFCSYKEIVCKDYVE